MLTTFSSRAWYEYTGWQLENKKILKRINALIKDIERNGNTGIGKPEPLSPQIFFAFFVSFAFFVLAAAGSHAAIHSAIALTSRTLFSTISLSIQQEG